MEHMFHPQISSIPVVLQLFYNRKVGANALHLIRDWSNSYWGVENIWIPQTMNAQMVDNLYG